ncbi:Transcriptional regulator, LysR family [hydrothermal vent metagenome]|uniref:Transcriptional regulator, LysR family n=1 Tax=hydrothermal vent metagenome TaxID=652676 RepID=A0A3B1AX07_9ZZZZ
MNSIDWDGFRYFIAAAETGSLSAAAKLLDSNQPTIGRQIDALEAALEIKLFQRHAKGLTLTQEGAYILQQSQSMRSLVVKATRTMQEKKEDISGSVKIAIPEGLCIEILLPELSKFYQQHPSINLILNVSPNTANLTSGEADIAIRLFRPDNANLVVTHIGDMEMGLYASKSYSQAHDRIDKLSDLKHHAVILYGDTLSALPENQWLEKQISASRCILRSDNTTTRLKATKLGLGISIQPQLFSIRNNDLQRLIKDAVIPGHEIWLVYHQDLRNTQRVRAVVTFIHSTLRAFL